MQTMNMTVGFVVWIVTTQCVNFAFYLTLTRVTYGWWRTVGAYAVYLVSLAVVFLRNPLLHGGAEGAEGSLAMSFASFFILWGVLSVALSRGALGRRIFSVLLCGIHQLVAFALSLLFLRYVKSSIGGPLLASGLMALMGCFLIGWIWPRVERMPDNSGWIHLNVMAVAIFVLLYAAGIWPVFVATGSTDHVVLFFVAAVVAFVFFPSALAFAEKNRLASSLAMVEDNLRMMANEMRIRREAMAEARRIRNDRRGRREAIGGFLKKGQVKEALDYLRRLDDEEGETLLAESVWCENETVNALFSGYSRKAEAAGLHFSALADINVQNDLSEIEMVEIMSNLLEIAIRTANEGGEVTCLLRQRGESFGLTVTNTVSADFSLTHEGLPCSRSDIGLESVRRIVRKRRGECHYLLKDGLLTCEAFLSSEASGK